MKIQKELVSKREILSGRKKS